MGEYNQGNDSDEALSAYAGRWIARLGGRIVGQGGTPRQASRAAKAARYKETPQVIYVPTANPFKFSGLLTRIRSVLPSNVPLYLVGGAVRDALLGQTTRDWDFGTPGDALKVARVVAEELGASYFPLDEERSTARLIVIDEDGIRHVLDFAAFRGADLEDDLRARDITINALAVDVNSPDTLFDPLGGAADLRAGVIRACSATTFDEDPLRIVRAIRFAAHFDFRIVPDTRSWMRANIDQLTSVSAERIRDELFRILDGPQPATALRALDMLGALAHMLPELSSLKNLAQSQPHVFDVWGHTLDAVNKLESLLHVLGPSHDPEVSASLTHGLVAFRLGRYRQKISSHFATRSADDRSLRALLFLATLYHDAGKSQTGELDDDGKIRYYNHAQEGIHLVAERAKALHLSNNEIARLKTIVGNHMRPLFMAQGSKLPSRRAVYRFFRDVGDCGIDIGLISLADVLATYGPTLPQDKWANQVDVVRRLWGAVWERYEELVDPPKLITGNDLLQEFDLESGPLIGELLEMVKEAQAVGTISSREEALSLVRAKMD